jgi:hypothetical protein
MLNKNFLSNQSCDFFDKIFIKTILYELDWKSVLEYLIYFINNEDKYHDIQFISNLSQLLLSVFHINNIEQSSNDKIQLVEFFQLLLSFLNQTSIRKLSISKTKFYTPPLSFENEIDNLSFLIHKILRHMKINNL